MQLPALNEFGQSNFEYSYNVGFDTAHYQNLKTMADRVTWECVYMQNPIERDGLLFTDLDKFLDIPLDPPDDIFCVGRCCVRRRGFSFYADSLSMGGRYIHCRLCIY